MTFRCEACQVNWAAGQTRGGACIQCGSGCVRITTEEPDADATILYRLRILAENEQERRRIRNLEFEEYYEKREARRGPDAWAGMTPPDEAAELAGWVGL